MIGKITGQFENYAPLMLRIALGIIFLYHGGQKLFGLFDGGGLERTGFQMAGMGFKPGMLWAVMVGCAEFFGAVFVLFGFMTRYSAAILGAIMVVAVLWVHGFESFQEIQLQFVLFMMAVTLVITGAGKMSFDDRMGKMKDSV